MRKDPDRHGDNGHVTLEAETTVLQLEAKEHQGKQMSTRGWREGFSPWSLQWENGPASTWIWDP